MYPFIVQGSNITVVIDGVPHTVSKSHVSYTKLKEAIRESRWHEVKDLVDSLKAIKKFSKGYVTIENDELSWKGKPLHNAISRRIVEMFTEGFDINPMVLFLENLMKNPSYRSVEELYGFLEKNNLPITPDGHFLAFKKVRDDYKDIYSGSMDNSVGKVLTMERNLVDDNANRTCSSGLHFCSSDYLPHFGRSSGDRIVIVKINPADVVSIPTDYDNAKGRTCRYEVIGEVTQNVEGEFTKPVQENANSWSPRRDGWGNAY